MTRTLPLTLLTLLALAAPAAASPVNVGSGGLDWKQTSLYTTATPSPNDRTFLGFFNRQSTGADGNPNGTVSTEAPATGGPAVPANPPSGTNYTFSFPAKATGAFDPATGVGEVQFDGQVRFTSPAGAASGFPETKASIDDPRIVFDGTTVAKVYGTGFASDGTAFDATKPIFALTLPAATPTQSGGTYSYLDAYPRIATSSLVFKFGFPAGQADRTPATFGKMDIRIGVAPPAVTVTPVTDLNPLGQTLTVSGTGASKATQGLYVYLSAASATATQTTAAPTGGSAAAFSWVKQTGISDAGAFSTTITAKSPFTSGAGDVDCKLVPCVVRTIAAHFADDRSQDTVTPVAFGAAPAVTPTPTATAAVTATATPIATTTATPTATPTYTVPTVKKPKVSKVKLTRRRLVFTLSKKAKVAITIKRGKKTVRKVTVKAKKGRTVIAFKAKKRLRKGTYRIALKPSGGTKKTATIKVK